MKRLLATISSMLIFFAFLSLMSILLGRSEVPVDHLSSLGVTKCGFEFCVLGIYSGTEWNEAKAKLINHVNSTEEDSSDITINQNEYKVSYWTSLKSKTNIEMESNNSYHLLSLGELIQNFNEPCSMTLTDEGAYFEYPQFVAGVSLPQDSDTMKRTFLTPQSQITDILFWDSYPYCKARLTFPSSYNIFLSWCGFTSLGQYLQRCKTDQNRAY